MGMKKPTSRVRREYTGPSKSDPQEEREMASKFLDSLSPKPTSPASGSGMDHSSTVELIDVAGQGARLLLTAEASLKELPALMSEAQSAALDQIETAILIAQALFKEIARAALYSLPSDFKMKPDDEKAFDEIVEDDEKYSLAEMKNAGLF
jgi:hypothetical protein